MLSNNERLINIKCKWILDKLNSVSKSSIFYKINVEKNPGKAPTIFLAEAYKKIYLHSKYNPYEEAKRFIDHFENISGYDYVVFFGMALGYHIEYFVNNHPHIPFSIFEPEFDIFRRCLETRDISFLERSSFDNFYFPELAPFSEKNLIEFLNGLNGNVLVIPLASYETAFPDDYKSFYEIFGQYFSNNTILDNTKKHNEKLHTVNVLENFEFILDTPNILSQDKDIFVNKPAIIVSAGPSLEYEIDNLKYIKENNLAYIFSAASAINTLIDNNIYPHACWSIDPDSFTQIVYKKMILHDITSIPLIFGTTTSSQVVSSYPGNVYHFITSKDLVTPYYVGNNISSEQIVDTASSVAVVVLLALHKLGFSPIILVGQNFAYKDQRYYSSGIDYGKGSNPLQNHNSQNLYKIQSVDGDYVFSDDALNCFRKDMEHYIRYYKIDNVINTTRNGAAIKGTIYMPLAELLNAHLKEKAVDLEWESKLKNTYNLKNVKAQSASIKSHMSNFFEIVHRLNDLANKIHSSKSANIAGNLKDAFFEIFTEIITNTFFHVFLYSMNVYECKMLIKYIKSIKNNNLTQNVPVSLFDKLMNFVDTCIKDLDTILPLIKDVEMQIPDCITFSIIIEQDK